MLNHWIRNRVSLSLLTAAFVLVLGVGQQARAGYTWEVFGGELEVAGFTDIEARVHTFADGEATYLNQLITRLQVEATITWEDVGMFDEIAFTMVARPQFDWGHYYGSTLSGDRTGRDPEKTPAGADDFTHATDPVGYGGFDYSAGRLANGGAIFATGGLEKVSLHEQNTGSNVLIRRKGDFLDEFAVIGDEQFPIVFPLTDRNLVCPKCTDIDDDHFDVALGNTDSNGRMYPFRELYADLRIGDVWIRVGKQQLVWGKTDFFRLQDVLNPVDFGQHFFFDSFEDIRIPQWMLSAQWRPGSIGPFTDTAIQVVWNFDRFQRVGVGAPYSNWGFNGAARQLGTFALFNTYFSAEPCAPGGSDFDTTTSGAGDINIACGNATNSAAEIAAGLPLGAGTGFATTPAGFGTPAGLGGDNLPAWNFGNTEIAVRIEARLGKVRFALTNHYGWWDNPAVHWRSVTLASTIGGVSSGIDPALVNDTLWIDRSQGLGIASFVGTPEAVCAAAQAATVAATVTAAGNCDDPQAFYGSSFGFLTPGGQVEFEYDKVNTLGLAVDYFDDWTGIVFRLESSWSKDVPVTNTNDLDWLDSSDFVQFALGMDRPTFIKFLNPTRTFFISSQIFHTYWLDHEGDNNDGFFTDRHNWILTFFIQGNYLRDRLTPQAFVVWEEASGAWVSGIQAQWLFTNNWSIVGGINAIWGTPTEDSHAIGPFTGFTLNRVDAAGSAAPGGHTNPTNVNGLAQEGIASLRNRDELFVRLRYSF